MPAQHVTSVRFADRDVTKAGMITDFTKACRGMAPLVCFVTKSLDLPW